MRAGDGPSDSGRSPAPPGLGPHVVGLRVVVRRVLPGSRGPTGGPALTDVLGVCERWDADSGAMVVRREDGEAVLIRLADIVSGKPVPPRPSVRMRVSARAAEGHALVLWPRLDITELGEWVLRSDPLLAPDQRLVKRANSCLAMGSPGIPVAEALARVQAFYAERERPALLQVETGEEVESAALEHGWRPLVEGAASFQLAPVARVLRALGSASPTLPAVELVEEATEARVEMPQVRGRAVLDGDWLGIHDLAVDPAHRRRGLARAVLSGLLDWGASQGASTAWLHVEIGNAAALGLYGPLGFAEHHGYRYLGAPEPDAAGGAGGGTQRRAGTGA